MQRLVFAFFLLAGCQDSLEQDGADDEFLDDGKSDSGGVRENSSPGFAVLRVANELDAAALEDDAGISAMTAKNIVAHRAGPDGQLGSSDDNRFDTLAELDAVPFVGPVAFQKLLNHAMALGFIVYDWRTHIIGPRVTGVNREQCMVTGPVDAKQMRFMFAGIGPRIDIRSSTFGQTLGQGFTGWSDPIPGSQATFSVFIGNRYIDCTNSAGALSAVAVREPLAVDDPFRFATQVLMSTPTPDGARAGEIGGFSLPNLLMLDQISKSASTSCATSQTTVRYVPPTDGIYTFRSFDNRLLAIRDGGSEGPELACDERTVSVKLRKDQPVAIAVGTIEPSFTSVSILRAQHETSCTDGFDDNGNGVVDCADAECAEACRTKEVCTNGIDDNGDGDVDCFDADCVRAPSCSSNTCPGVDLGAAASSSGPVAAGNGTLAPVAGRLVCDSTTLPWTGSRFYTWRAPAAGSYRFRVDSVANGLLDWGVRLFDGTCDGDVLACSAHTGSGPEVVRTMAANQPIVIEVGLVQSSNGPKSFELSIRKL